MATFSSTFPSSGVNLGPPVVLYSLLPTVLWTEMRVLPQYEQAGFPCEFCENFKNLRGTCRTMQDLVQTYNGT